MTGTVTANASVENKSMEANVIFPHLSHRRGDRVALDRLVAVWPAQTLAHFSLRVPRKSEHAQGGPQQTCNSEHLYAHISVKPQALRALQVAQRMKCSRQLRSQLTDYAWLAAFVAVYSGL